MKILALATTFPRWKGDTEPPFVLDLCRHLVSQGHEITVLVPHAEGSARREEMPAGEKENDYSPLQQDAACREGMSAGEVISKKVHVCRFPYWPWESGQRLCYNGGALPNLRSSWQARFNLPVLLWQQNRWLGRLLERERYDLIHSHWIVPQGLFAVRHGAKRKLPVVITAHAGDVFPLRKPGLRQVLRHTLLSAGAVTANSRATSEALRQAAPEVHPHIIPMGVDPPAPDAAEVREIRRRLAPEGPLILNAGRFAPKKGQIYLLRAMSAIVREFPSARLVLIGFGPLEEDLRREIRSLNLQENVSIEGKVPHQRMSAYLAAADVFTLPSIISPSGDTEGLGVVLLEAMAAGTPVVASEVGGIPDVVIHRETGLLAPQKQPEELAQAVLEILKNKSLAGSLVQGGREHVVANFSWTSIASRFSDLFEQAAGQFDFSAKER